MTTGSNKLVDKYQYNDLQIKTDGLGKYHLISSWADNCQTYSLKIIVYFKEN